MILNGHVGDELFAGYWDHYMYNLRRPRAHGPPRRSRPSSTAWRPTTAATRAEYPRTRRGRGGGRERGGAADVADASTTRPSAPDVLRGGVRPERATTPTPRRGLLTSRLYQELTYETVPATLRPEDRNSMAFSIESRSPFLDYRLVELAFALPNRFKIRDGLGNG